MSSYSDRDVYSQTGSWLLGTVRRNPEALLLMAAGCCLMMRSRSSSRTSVRPCIRARRVGVPHEEGFLPGPRSIRVRVKASRAQPMPRPTRQGAQGNMHRRPRTASPTRRATMHRR